jgi:hypothetical protein
LDVELRAVRVKNYQQGTVHAFLELCGALGYDNPMRLCPDDLYQRTERGLLNFNQIYTPLLHGQLLNGELPAAYSSDWQRASAQCFC